MQKVKNTITDIKEKYLLSGRIDYVFLCTVFILFTIGLVMMYSASYASAESRMGDAEYYLKRQFFIGLAGFVCMFVISKIDYRILNSRLAFIGYFATIGLLVFSLIFNRGGGDQETSRWIDLGFIRFQPSEIAKFTLILIMAYCMCVLQKSLRAPKGMQARPTFYKDASAKWERKMFSAFKGQFSSGVLLLALIAVYCLLILLQKHMSATILVFLIGFSMIFLSGADKKYFYLIVGAVAAVVIIVILEPDLLGYLPGFAESRVKWWLFKDNPEYSEFRRQNVNGLYAIGSGGLFGVGFGESKQKQLFVYEPQNDFIFPIVIEELGFVGAVAILLLFAYLIYRGYKIAIKCKDYFGSLLVMGIMNQIAIQTIINLLVVTDLIPNTGMSLPFFSYGGTAILILLCEIGVVLSVSRMSSVEKA